MKFEGQEQFIASSLTTDFSTLPVTYCTKVGDVLSLKGEKNGKLVFVGGVEGWGNDHEISIDYTVNLKIRSHWQDDSTFDEIELTLGNFEGTYNGKQIGKGQEEQMKIELYLESKGIDIAQEVRKAYLGGE